MSTPNVAIVGAGFGGLRAARALRRAQANVVLVDRNNYHLFQPLLYQVATAGLSPDEIAYPVRAIFQNQRNLEFRLAEVTAVDFTAKRLSLSTGELNYDYLILAI
ncbi:MAG TPA: FAD-dependent oxidoreductase, partial [Anaerolineales bacterium]|nr:FAD-dependent oxidoreductase [Anaerolineales bacterium]